MKDGEGLSSPGQAAGGNVGVPQVNTKFGMVTSHTAGGQFNKHSARGHVTAIFSSVEREGKYNCNQGDGNEKLVCVSLLGNVKTVQQIS